jgi:molybdopterin-guanine dinucleotide biosynthesis protein B
VTPPPLLAFQAPSGTGKTTLLAEVVAALTRAGLRVATLKHTRHDHPIDKPGSDTDRMRLAGAVGTALVTPSGAAVVHTAPHRDPRALAATLFPDADIVLVEGWRGEGLPVVRVRRAGGPPDESWETPDPVVAWATDAHGTPGDVLPLDGLAVAAWIRDGLARGSFQR